MSTFIEIDKTVKNYILDCISNDGYEDTPYFNECSTTDQKIDFLKAVFIAEYGFNIKRAGELTSMKEWISGLPSSFNIEYRNDEILKLAIKWGSLSENASESAEYKIIENWFNFIAAKTVQLFNGYRVPKEV